jgi:outer membrane protein assembly factor BamB
MRTPYFATILMLIWAVALQSNASSQDWSRFRGPNGTGVIKDADLPIDRKQTSWIVNLAGSGNSSPVAWQDKIFVTSCDTTSAAITIECFDDRQGKKLWSKTFDSKPHHLHGRNTFAASTPTVDADHVYLAFANPDQTILVALSHEGEQIWRRDLGRWVSSHGFGTSPIVYKNLLVFCNSQSGEALSDGVAAGQSKLLAVDRSTGEDNWAVELTTRRACYSVPCIWTDETGTDQIVNCNTGDGFYSIDPVTGKKNWSALPFKMRTVASILATDHLLIGSCGSGGGGNYLVAMKPEGSTSRTQGKPAFRLRQANYVPCPIAVNGLLFVVTDKGIGHCVDLNSGKEYWKKRLSNTFSSSPVANEKHIFLVGEDGQVLVIDAAKEFKIASKFELGEPTRATPMIYRNRLYFRTRTKLICVGK